MAKKKKKAAKKAAAGGPMREYLLNPDLIRSLVLLDQHDVEPYEPDDGELVDLETAARIMGGVSVKTVETMIRHGRLMGVVRRGRPMVPLLNVTDFVRGYRGL